MSAAVPRWNGTRLPATIFWSGRAVASSDARACPSPTVTRIAATGTARSRPWETRLSRHDYPCRASQPECRGLGPHQTLLQLLPALLALRRTRRIGQELRPVRIVAEEVEPALHDQDKAGLASTTRPSLAASAS